MVELLHPQAGTKPKLFNVAATRQGGSLSAKCECGWYCMHNHKAFKQARLCEARHVLAIKDIADVAPKDLLAQWEWDEEEARVEALAEEE